MLFPWQTIIPWLPSFHKLNLPLICVVVVASKTFIVPRYRDALIPCRGMVDGGWQQRQGWSRHSQHIQPLSLSTMVKRTKTKRNWRIYAYTINYNRHNYLSWPFEIFIVTVKSLGITPSFWFSCTPIHWYHSFPFYLAILIEADSTRRS